MSVITLTLGPEAPSPFTDEEDELIPAKALEDLLPIPESDSPLEPGGGIETLARSAVLLEVSMTERLFLLDGVDAAEKVTGEGLARRLEPSQLPVRAIVIELN